jgi:hypothetical protein
MGDKEQTSLDSPAGQASQIRKRRGADTLGVASGHPKPAQHMG